MKSFFTTNSYLRYDTCGTNTNHTNFCYDSFLFSHSASLFVFVFFIFFTAGLWAQDDIFKYPLGSSNMNAFTSTCSRLGEHPFIKGNFEQEKTLSRLERSLKSSGNFIISADMGMVWDTAKPFPSTLTLGKDYLIQAKSGGQKTIISAQGNETFIRLAEVLSAVFSGNSKKLLDNFDIYFSGSGADWKIGLSPRDKTIGSFADKIIMTGGTAIRSIQIFEQNGDTIRYILSNHSYPAELNTNEKSFFSLP